MKYDVNLNPHNTFVVIFFCANYKKQGLDYVSNKSQR